MNLLVGTDLEVIKEVNLQTYEWKNVVIGKSLKTKSAKDKEGICGMCWKNRQQESIFYVTKHRRIKQFEVDREVTQELFQCCPDASVAAAGICSLESTGKIVLGTEDGRVHLCSAEEEESSWSSGGHLQVLRHSAERSQLLTGGLESDMKLWDVARLSAEVTPLFAAKNVRPDELCLRRGIRITDANFLPDGRRVIVTTGHADVRIYDPSSCQRRPVLETRWGDSPITCLALGGREDVVYVGNTAGQAAALDLRRRGTVLGHFKKIAGSVRALACSNAATPSLISCASDRFLRVHHLESRELLQEIYLKLKPQLLLVLDSVKVHEKDDDLWDSMVPIKDCKKRKIK